MSRLMIGRLITAVAALGCIIGALIFVISPAYAGNFGLAAVTPGAATVTATTTTPTTTITPTITPTSTSGTTTAPYVPTNLFIVVLLILLLFGLLLIAGLLFYIYRVQQKYYAASQSLSQMGVTVKTTVIASIFKSGDVTRTVPASLKIEGLESVTVGTPATFTATKVENQGPATPATDAAWKVDPTGAASVSPETGEKVIVTPLKKGSFKLTARITGYEPPAELTVSAVAPQATTLELPFIGQGYGSLVIAILVVVAVILLALTGTLQGEAVGTLLGGLLGYIFGVNTSSGGAPPKNSGSNSPGASS